MTKERLILITATLLMFATAILLPKTDIITANAEEEITYKVICVTNPDEFCFCTLVDGVLDITTGKLMKIQVIDPDDDPHL